MPHDQVIQVHPRETLLDEDTPLVCPNEAQQSHRDFQAGQDPGRVRGPAAAPRSPRDGQSGAEAPLAAVLPPASGFPAHPGQDRCPRP